MGFYSLPDHPVIRNIEATGYPDGKEPAGPVCPACGRDEISAVYFYDNTPIGCDRCIKEKDAPDEAKFCIPDGTLKCPVCGKECDTAILSSRGSILGCENCISKMEAWGCDACFPERRR